MPSTHAKFNPKFTVQELSESGSFAFPEGNVVHHCPSIGCCHRRLETWARIHNQVGADQQEAFIRVWHGYHDDVTDIYPDFELRYGPKGGVQRIKL